MPSFESTLLVLVQTLRLYRNGFQIRLPPIQSSDARELSNGWPAQLPETGKRRNPNSSSKRIEFEPRQPYSQGITVSFLYFSFPIRHNQCAAPDTVGRTMTNAV